jgi:hypothetical protein
MKALVWDDTGLELKMIKEKIAILQNRQMIFIPV